MLAALRLLRADRSGATMVEFAIIALLFFLLTGGLIDFTFALYQWNSASKALQVGVRLASISDPVDSGLKAMDGLGAGVNPGDPFPPFSSVCSGASHSCSCTGVSHSCTYSATAMNTIVYGRGQNSCGTVGTDQTAAMCDIFPRIQPANVRITYQGTGLGFAGRPGGPVPTITVEVTNLTFSFIFLNGLFGSITMPAMKTTATGEDMSTAAP